MQKLISWFQLNYPNYCKALYECKHNFDDTTLNPYHLEGDCWSHTMMVCKVSHIEEYDKVVQIAALLHDIGKPNVRKVNPNNNHVQFFNHEIYSAYLSIDILRHMTKEKMINKEEFLEIFVLVAFHSLLHIAPDESRLIKLFEYDKSLYMHLLELSRCDNMGRFYEKGGNSTEEKLSFKKIAIKLKDDKQKSTIYNVLNNSDIANKDKKYTFEEVKSMMEKLIL